MAQTPQLDPVALITAAAAGFFSAKAAAYIGPYAVIMLGSALGAYMALADREKAASRLSAAGFFAAAIGTAFLGTVLLTKLVKLAVPLLEDVEDSFLFGIVAWVIGLLGHRWKEAPRLIDWVRGYLGRREEPKQ